MFNIHTLNCIIICGIVLILDEVSTVFAVNQTENLTAPKFKKLDGLSRVMIGYERNTMKLNCEAEGR